MCVWRLSHSGLESPYIRRMDINSSLLNYRLDNKKDIIETLLDSFQNIFIHNKLLGIMCYVSCTVYLDRHIRWSHLSLMSSGQLFDVTKWHLVSQERGGKLRRGALCTSRAVMAKWAAMRTRRCNYRMF